MRTPRVSTNRRFFLAGTPVLPQSGEMGHCPPERVCYARLPSSEPVVGIVRGE